VNEVEAEAEEEEDDEDYELLVTEQDEEEGEEEEEEEEEEEAAEEEEVTPPPPKKAIVTKVVNGKATPTPVAKPVQTAPPSNVQKFKLQVNKHIIAKGNQATSKATTPKGKTASEKTASSEKAAPSKKRPAPSNGPKEKAKKVSKTEKANALMAYVKLFSKNYIKLNKNRPEQLDKDPLEGLTKEERQTKLCNFMFFFMNYCHTTQILPRFTDPLKLANLSNLKDPNYFDTKEFKDFMEMCYFYFSTYMLEMPHHTRLEFDESPKLPNLTFG